MKVDNLLNNAIKILREKGIDNASLNARILMAFTLNMRKDDLILHLDDEVEYEVEKIFLKRIEKLKNGYPLQYITNNQEFMKMNFFVNEDVLIPRSDTEILVEETIKVINENEMKKLLELCTGSGAISISLERYLEGMEITASDISQRAIEIAKKNEKNLIDSPKINFINSDMFQRIEGKFDIIVSNPPYIKKNVIEEYNLEYEPKIALDRRR